MEYKKPLSITEQIEYLKNNKRIIFNEIDEYEAGDILSKYGYINVISPFKYVFCEKKNGIPIKVNGNHIYNRDVDFSEYYNKYLEERNKYKTLYKNISKFEVKFNSIVTHNIIMFYDINSTEKFNEFVQIIKSNIQLSKYKQTVKDHMVEEISKFEENMEKYESVYIFMDRLSLGTTITLFRCCDNHLRKTIFNNLLKYNATVGYKDFDTFDDFLFRIVSIRNCISHNNSLTVLTRYYDIKEKLLRKDSDRRKYKNIIKRLL